MPTSNRKFTGSDLMENNLRRKENRRVFIIAEVGLNHNGNIDLAVKSIEEAAKAGADAVKFQNYRTEDFIFDRSLTYTYLSQGKEVTESMWDLCKRCETKREWLPPLKKICDTLSVEFMSTPTSESGVDDLIDVGVNKIKNGSDYLTHLPLLKYMGSTGATVIISTGMADSSEVQDAVDAVRSGGKSNIILMHCTSSYPTKASDVNLNRMIALQEVFSWGILTLGTHNMSYAHNDKDIQNLLSVYDAFFAILKDVVENVSLKKYLRCEPLVSLFKVR